jgi:nucleoside-diphosphate-sugar epimerase
MKIFITGATGYIGRPLAVKLAENGHIVHALVRDPGSARIPVHPNIRLFTGDIASRQAIKNAVRGCGQAYHVAGLTRLWAKDKGLFYEVNVSGTQNVLTEALENGVSKLVYTSSCAVFGPSHKEPMTEKDPRLISFGNDYDLSKYICECLVKEFAHRGLFSVIVNPSRVYGPGIDSHSNPLTRIMRRCLNGKYVFIPGCRDVLANYAFIDDVVNGHLSAMQKGVGGERYILGGESLSYQQVFSVLKEEIGCSRLKMIHPSILKGIGWMELMRSKLTGAEPAFTPSVVKRITRNAALDCKKAIRQIDYRITPFREGIRQTIENLKMNDHG